MQTDNFMTPDGFKIHTVYWQPTSESDRVVILVHGLSEHSGRYQHVAEHLTQAGYHVYSQDNRGHGLSSGERQHLSSHTSFINDLKQHYDRIKQNHPNSKIFMLGHSLGSVISLQFVLTNPKAIDALIVTGTATDVAPSVSPILRTIGNVLNRISKNMPISPPGGNEALTKDPDMLRAAAADELFYHGWTKTGIAKFALDMGEEIQNRASEITLPILIMHGKEDEVTPVSGSEIMYERVSSTDKTIKLWDGMRHEILNEVDRAAVLALVTDWLSQH